ncbi:MAG: excinuclease ABC subunit UvrC [Nitrospirae bacterium]|nr:excinuclease ABC subunit UvrC [Nitrospirota bacterium]
MSSVKESVIERLASVPQKPGVYTFKSTKERVIYVGKAKNLRNRLKSYFRGLDIRKTAMMGGVKNFSFIVTANELEAFVLEANLIKQYKPKFNIVLRDDKNYPYIKLRLKEEWPTLEVVRKIKKDGSLYFGPYVPSGSMWTALSFIRRNFNIRPCRYKLDKPMRPCIQYQMGRCPAPCAGYISRQEYMKAVDEVTLFLKGERKELIKGLERKMQVLSDEMRYEDAGRIRDRLNSLKRVWESQKVVSPELGDMDVIGSYTENKDSVFQVFFIRNGVMLGSRDFYLRHVSKMPPKKLYHSFLQGFYSKELLIPPLIVVGIKPEGQMPLLRWLSQKRGGKVKIVLTKKGRRLELLKMAEENARLKLKSKKGSVTVLEELTKKLGIKSVPHSIGAFDVSTVSGTDSVGAFVYWSDGYFNKDMYRHLKIKTVLGIDDCAMVEETVRRVFLKDMESRSIGIQLPDLIVIDGGKGQLDAAYQALGVNAKDTALLAVAKNPDRAFTLLSETPLDLEDKTPSSLLLKRIRDEAHRFAVSFHRRLRSKRLMESSLEKVKGIGKKRRLSLLRHFGSIDAIRRADIEEILKVPGMNRKVAQAVKEGFR